MAPELCNEEEYDYKVDVWAVGALAYVLLCGRTPFRGRSKEDISYEICFQQPDFYYIERASDHAKAFVEACLQKKAVNRPTA